MWADSSMTLYRRVSYSDTQAAQGLENKSAAYTAALKEMVKRALDRYDFVRFTFSDLHGVARSKTVCGPYYPKFFEKGVEVYSGMIACGPRAGQLPPKCLREVMTHGQGNVVLLPAVDTLHDVCWCADPTSRVGEVLCESYWITDHSSQAASPRDLARRQVDKLLKLGYRIFSGVEVEVTVLEDGDFDRPVIPSQSIFSNLDLARVEKLLYGLTRGLRRAGVEVEVLQTEYGAGQLEFVLKPVYGVEAADMAFMLKDGVHGGCLQYGKEACFMSRPYHDGTSCGMHFNHSLVNRSSGVRVFSDLQTADRLSPVARHWVAGIIKHSRALTALLSPTVNCYRRLHNPRVTRANWGIDNRGMAYRVKNRCPESTYVECRLPGAAANPYLVMAGVVAAGIDGLVNKLNPPPVDDPEAEQLPATLEEALVCLEKDTEMVEALGEEFVRWFVTCKREMELVKFPNWAKTREEDTVFQAERDLYAMYI